MKPPAQGGKPIRLSACAHAGGQSLEVRRRGRLLIGGRVPVDQAVVLIGLERLLTPALAPGREPCERHWRPASTCRLGGRQDEIQRAPHEPVVQLGDEAAGLRRAGTATRQPPHHRGNARGHGGQGLLRCGGLDLAGQSDGLGPLQEHEVMTGDDAEQSLAGHHRQVADSPTRHLEQGVEGERAGADRRRRDST